MAVTRSGSFGAYTYEQASVTLRQLLRGVEQHVSDIEVRIKRDGEVLRVTYRAEIDNWHANNKAKNDPIPAVAARAVELPNSGMF